MKDEKFPKAFHFGEGNKELSLDEIMAQDANDDAAEDKLINGQRRNEKTKKVALITGTSILAIAVTAGFLFFTPFGGDLNFNKSSDKASVAADSNKTGDQEPGPDRLGKEFMSGGDVKGKDLEKFAQDDSNKFPLALKDWEKESYSKQDPNELRAAVLKTVSGTEIGNGASVLPTESSGYTSDLSKTRIEDGTLNPMFSFWTAEGFDAETGTFIQRLLNPTFGNWESFQYSTARADTSIDTGVVADMFTSDWRTKNLNKLPVEYVPIYADWAANDYGMPDKLLTSGTRWYGKITSSDTTFTYNKEEFQYSADITAQVSFTAWAKDQTKLEKKGTLTLHLVPNVDNQNGSGHKVAIESASLKVDG